MSDRKIDLRGSPTHTCQFIKGIGEVPNVLIYNFYRIGEIPSVPIHHLRHFVWKVQEGAV